MTHKIYDLAVKTGTYQKDGQEKGRYENVGSVMQGDKGQFLILKRTFNPAGVPNPDCKDSVLISFFEPKGQQDQQQAQQQQAPAPQQQAPAPQRQQQARQQPQHTQQGFQEPQDEGVKPNLHQQGSPEFEDSIPF